MSRSTKASTSISDLDRRRLDSQNQSISKANGIDAVGAAITASVLAVAGWVALTLSGGFHGEEAAKADSTTDPAPGDAEQLKAFELKLFEYLQNTFELHDKFFVRTYISYDAESNPVTGYNPVDKPVDDAVINAFRGFFHANKKLINGPHDPETEAFIKAQIIERALKSIKDQFGRVDGEAPDIPTAQLKPEEAAANPAKVDDLIAKMADELEKEKTEHFTLKKARLITLWERFLSQLSDGNKEKLGIGDGDDLARKANAIANAQGVDQDDIDDFVGPIGDLQKAAAALNAYLVKEGGDHQTFVDSEDMFDGVAEGIPLPVFK